MPVTGRGDDPGDRSGEEVRVDLGAAPAEVRQGIDLLLNAERVVHRWSGPVLVLGADDAERAAELLQLAVAAPAGRGPGEPEGLASDPGAAAPDETHLTDEQRYGPLATPGRRLIALGLDVAAAAVAALAARALAARRAPTRSRPTVIAGLSLWWVADRWLAVALTGRSLGCFVAGVRLMVPPRPGRPGAAPALRRWTIGDSPLLVAAVASTALVGRARRGAVVTAAVGVGVAVAVRLPALRDPWRRGRHDRAASAVVVASRARRSALR
jgi:hypothetical protein